MVIGTRTSQLFCLTVFGLCPWPDVEAYTVEMSAKPNTTRPTPSGQTPIQVVHISDIHVDLSYEYGPVPSSTLSATSGGMLGINQSDLYVISPISQT